MCFDKSRILPFLSNAAGFSFPNSPTLNSFIFSPFYIVIPPSTEKIFPVAKVDSSLAK